MDLDGEYRAHHPHDQWQEVFCARRLDESANAALAKWYSARAANTAPTARSPVSARPQCRANRSYPRRPREVPRRSDSAATLERAWKHGVARSAVGVSTETGREFDGGNEDALRGDRNRGLRSRIPLHGRFWMGGPTPYERSMTVLDRHRRPAPSAGTETTGLGRRGVSTR
jgi:hypothetical protein